MSQSSAPLLRQLGVVSATALVVSNMVGTGIFTTTGFLAGDLGSPGLVMAIWLVGAVCALAGAFCYSELGMNFPSSGGEYVYLTEAYGPTWGFMTGWVSFLAGFSAANAGPASRQDTHNRTISILSSFIIFPAVFARSRVRP